VEGLLEGEMGGLVKRHCWFSKTKPKIVGRNPEKVGATDKVA